MKDQRVAYFRTVLDGLVESLDATVRVSRWQGAESVPEPLAKAAAQLVERLGAANRLAAGKFTGSPVVVASVAAMSGAIQKLDTAFVEYRRGLAGTTAQKQEAALALDAELDGVRQDAHRWS
jgi:hypothetical protein